MTNAQPTDEPASSLAGLLHYLLVGGLFLAALCGGIWLIVVFDRIGSAQDIGLLRFAGLALDIGLLAALTAWLHRREHPLASTLGPMLALLGISLFFSVYDWHLHGARASFWSLGNVQTIAVQTATVAVAALGMTMIIIAGGIDLSAGTALSLCATVLAYALDTGHGIAAAIAACILCGALAGAVNGALTSLLGVVPFIITLGTMTAYLGVGKMIAKETTVRPPIDAIPAWLPTMVSPLPSPSWLIYPVLPNFGWGVWLALALAGLLAAVLHFTVFGRHVFAIGSNEATARLCGINVPWTKVAVYGLAGIFVGVAGMYQFARLSSGSPTSGIGVELKIIAAVVIGGGSLRGGRGSVLGTLTGAAMMLAIASGCTSLGLKNPVIDIIIGVIIVAAVSVDQFRNRLAG
jgi:ribose transport system permease protein